MDNDWNVWERHARDFDALARDIERVQMKRVDPKDARQCAMRMRGLAVAIEAWLARYDKEEGS